MTRIAASNWAPIVSSVGKTENHIPIHGGMMSTKGLIGVVEIQ